MLKSLSLSSVNEKKAGELRRRNHIAMEPTPSEMLDWLKGVKRGHLLVLVNKTGRPEDACVGDVGLDFLALNDAHPPEGVSGFRRLMRSMLTALVDVPPDGLQAAQSLIEGLDDQYAMNHGVVWTQTLCNQLTELVDALERDRQAQQDRKGVDLLEPVCSARESLTPNDEPVAMPIADVPSQSGVPQHAAPDTVTDLEKAGIGRPPLPTRTRRTAASLRLLPTTSPEKP